MRRSGPLWVHTQDQEDDSSLDGNDVMQLHFVRSQSLRNMDQIPWRRGFARELASDRDSQSILHSELLSTPSVMFCEVCWNQTNEPVGCSGCSHRYCVVCLRIHWQEQIFSGLHNRIQCMYGPCCGVMATDEDIRRVVDHRSYRKLLFFRSRELNAGRQDVVWCVKEECWELIEVSKTNQIKDPLTFSSCVQCRSCSTKVCFDCGGAWHVDGSKCPLVNKHRGTRGVTSSAWTMFHTKSCPTCKVRIQKDQGCLHMNCTRCGASFCWRCRGYLPCGWEQRGRACRCDTVVSGLLYTGIGVLTVAGSPIILGAAVVGGPSYWIYRSVRRHVKKRAQKRQAEAAEYDMVLESFNEMAIHRNLTSNS